MALFRGTLEKMAVSSLGEVFHHLMVIGGVSINISLSPSIEGHKLRSRNAGGASPLNLYELAHDNDNNENYEDDDNEFSCSTPQR